MPSRFQFRLSVVAVVVLFAGAGCAALPPNYEKTFTELSALIDGDRPRPAEMLRGGWLAAGYLTASTQGLGFNRVRFLDARTPGEAGLSGLFLAVHGTAAHHQIVCNTLENDRRKRSLLTWIFGTEAAFFNSLKGGESLRPLVSALPSTTGLRSLLKRLRGSRDGLVRRAGMFWGYWLADRDYWQSVREISERDPDEVNRACAAELLNRI